MRNRASTVYPRMPSIDAPGRPSAFMPTSWNGSSTRARISVRRAPPSIVKAGHGRPEFVLAGPQPELLCRLGRDVQGRGPRVDQEIERTLAIDPHPNQEVVRIRDAVGNLVRLADLGVGLPLPPLFPVCVRVRGQRDQGKRQSKPREPSIHEKCMPSIKASLPPCRGVIPGSVPLFRFRQNRSIGRSAARLGKPQPACQIRHTLSRETESRWFASARQARYLRGLNRPGSFQSRLPTTCERSPCRSPRRLRWTVPEPRRTAGYCLCYFFAT